MKCIGIIGAMEIEVNRLKEKVKNCSVETVAGMAFYKGLYGNTPVVIVRSGIGKVNAAICTQILVDRYHITAVINTGIAGGLYHKIHIGDIVIATEALQHDMDARGFGYKLGKYLRWIHRFLMLIQYCGRWRQRYADGLIRIFRYMKAELSVATALFPTAIKRRCFGRNSKVIVPKWKGRLLHRLHT